MKKNRNWIEETQILLKDRFKIYNHCEAFKPELVGSLTLLATVYLSECYLPQLLLQCYIPLVNRDTTTLKTQYNAGEILLCYAVQYHR